MPWKYNPFTGKLDYYETGTAVALSYLLTEDSDNLVTEAGDKIALNE